MSRKALKNVKLKAETENPNGFPNGYKMKTKSLLLLILRGSNIERNILNILLYICMPKFLLYFFVADDKEEFFLSKRTNPCRGSYLTSGKF